MPELNAPDVEIYLQDLRAMRAKIAQRFAAAAACNRAHPDRPPQTDDDVDPGRVLRTLDRHLWEAIAVLEAAVWGRVEATLSEVLSPFVDHQLAVMKATREN